jgi:hydroxyacylglutathione hydrolase
MKVLKDLYFFPWMSMQENNANTVFIDGPVPTLIDPGHAHLFSAVAESMYRDGIDLRKVKLIVTTHGHLDHIEAADRLGGDVLKGMSKEDYFFLNGTENGLSIGAGLLRRTRPFEILLSGGPLVLGDKTFTVIETPGHSPGSICLYWEKERVLLSGDTVFYLGVGRTDLPGGDPEKLAESIKKLSTLDIEYLLPGHGDMVKGKKAVERNFQAILTQILG